MDRRGEGEGREGGRGEGGELIDHQWTVSCGTDTHSIDSGDCNTTMRSTNVRSQL